MKYIFGNWKMYLDYNESVGLAQQLAEQFRHSKEGLQLGIFPSTLAIRDMVQILGSSPFVVGAQDVGYQAKGAYTGLVSAHLFKNIGCTHALVGHSERRHLFGESNEDTHKKIEACFDAGLIPVLCIGETQEDRDNDKTQYRLKKQLLEALQGLEIPENALIVAYEPVWAIGTGSPCLPEDAEDIVGWIKKEINQYSSTKIPVLYGGSVSEENIVSYVGQAHIDGVLVGGASAKFDSFCGLITQTESL